MPMLKTCIIFVLLLLAPMVHADEKAEALQTDESSEAYKTEEMSAPRQTDETSEAAPEKDDKKDSPWLITPLLSSDPKISTAAGVLAGYVYTFDEKSPASLFGVVGTYSTTDSWYAGAFGMAFLGEDKHRLTAAIATGEVRNDYADFLGSGLNVQTTDDVTMFGLRYRYRFYGRWFLGPQFISTNYAISGDNLLSGKVLEHIGLTGFKSNGLGLYTQYD